MEPEKEQQPKEEMQKNEGTFCKYNEATERCIFNPDLNARANDDECYKTDKSRCASKKKKIRKIKIKPKKVKEVEGMEKVEEAEVVTEIREREIPEVFCKYNEATERCIFNPDSNSKANDDECYKTDKSRCASKKKKMMKIKIKPKKVKEVKEQQQQEEQQQQQQEEQQVKKKIKIMPNTNLISNKNNDFLYPDLNDSNFNLKLAEKKRIL